MKLILIRGLPGSGKTTMAQKLTDYNHVEADMYFIRPDGFYDFNGGRLAQAHEMCRRIARDWLEVGNVVVSNTFVKKWEMQPYLDMAKELGAEVQILEAKGNFQNVHGVPENIIARMKTNWETL